jgi:sugar (pentulose or hexulose) kinase
VDRDGLAGLDRAALSGRPGASVVSVPDGPEAPRAEGSDAPGDVWRAATELVTAQARAVSTTITAAAGPRRELVVTGGWSHSASLMAAKAAALGPLWRTTAGEAGARGAALLAGLADGTYASYGAMPQAPRTVFSHDPA